MFFERPNEYKEVYHFDSLFIKMIDFDARLLYKIYTIGLADG